MPRDKFQKEKNKEIIEMAAEQFARLFWKQWHFMKKSEKSKSHENNLKKAKGRSSSSP